MFLDSAWVTAGDAFLASPEFHPCVPERDEVEPGVRA